MIRIDQVFEPVSRDQHRRVYAAYCTCHPNWGIEYSVSEELFWPSYYQAFAYLFGAAFDAHALIRERLTPATPIR